MNKVELIALIEQAFADTVYPGDDNLTRFTRPEYIRIAFDLRGKHWTTLTDAEFLPHEQFSLSYLQPEAFRFYLPAYMIAALKNPVAIELMPENIEPNLTPPETEGTEAEEWFALFAITRMDYFLSRVSGFSSDQKKVIKAYLVYSFANNWDLRTISEKNLQEQQATLQFWSTFEG